MNKTMSSAKKSLRDIAQKKGSKTLQKSEDVVVDETQDLYDTTLSFHKTVNAKKQNQIEGVDGVDMEIEGIVTMVCDSADETFFRLKSQAFDFEILCKYGKNYPVRKHDRANISGYFGHEIFMGLNQQCFIVDEITAFYFFDLNNFLIANFKGLTQESLNGISARIIDYAESIYAPEEGIPAVIECFNDLADNIEKHTYEIYNFTEQVFGDVTKYITNVRDFITNYINDSLKRPLQLLGISKDEIEAIARYRSLTDAYQIARENPYRLPEIKIDVAQRICSNVLRMKRIPCEWKDCGAVCREVYNRVHRSGWTSIPIAKIETMFPLSFCGNRERICKEYSCKEDMGSLYYEPLLKKEENVARFIASLLAGQDNEEINPLFPGFIPDEHQHAAICGSLKKRISFITGGAGTGKTQIEGEICRAIINAGYTPLCFAYTGAAVQRIKASLRDAQVLDSCKVMTIHKGCTQASLLSTFNIKYIIFDEFSMVDLSVFNWFINSFSFVNNPTLIFIGDINQLEPIAYGNVMEQLLKTPINIYRLVRNYRSETGILNVINRIIDPQRIEKQDSISWYDQHAEDFHFYTGDKGVLKSYIQFLFEEFIDEHQDLLDKIQHAYDNETDEAVICMLETQFEEKFKVYRDKITIVSPYNKIVDDTNIVFQEIFMASFPFVIIDGRKFHLGDRVMKLVNNYSIEVMNGEIGTIVDIKEDYVVVRFREDCPDPILCPFFSKLGLIKIKDMKKIVSYNPFAMTEGVFQKKTPEKIRSDLEELKEKLLKLRGTIEHKKINEFFEIANLYPYAIFGITNEKTEFLNIKSIKLAYAQTTRKSQGNQFDHTIFVLFKPHMAFVTRRQVYTGMSRAKRILTAICETEDLVNSAILTMDRYVYDNLAARINNKLPVSMRVQIEIPEDVDDYDIDFDENPDLDCTLDDFI